MAEFRDSINQNSCISRNELEIALIRKILCDSRIVPEISNPAAPKQKSAKLAFNVNVSAGWVKLARQDAKRFNKPMDGIGEAALRYLFSLKAAEREKFYALVPNKIRGRKVAAI